MWNSTRGGAFVKESLLRCRGRQRAAHRKKYGQSKIEIVSGPLPYTIKRKKEKKKKKKQLPIMKADFWKEGRRGNGAFGNFRKEGRVHGLGLEEMWFDGAGIRGTSDEGAEG